MADKVQGGLPEKYRPRVLSDAVGQSVAVRILETAIRTESLVPGYIFAGPYGCGKTSLAGIFSRSIGCPNRRRGTVNPCNNCDVCLSQTKLRSNDLRQIDAATKGSVDAIRSLREDASYAPAEGARRKVVILDEAHRLSGASWDARVS